MPCIWCNARIDRNHPIRAELLRHRKTGRATVCPLGGPLSQFPATPVAVVGFPEIPAQFSIFAKGRYAEVLADSAVIFLADIAPLLPFRLLTEGLESQLKCPAIFDAFRAVTLHNFIMLNNSNRLFDYAHGLLLSKAVSRYRYRERLNLRAVNVADV
jgi:hypothetical protein